MGEPMRVEDHRVNLRFDLPERPDDGGYLPERQNPRHVWELQRRLVPTHLDYRKTRKSEHHDGRVTPITLRGDVRPSHVSHAKEIQGWRRRNPRRQLVL